MGEKQAGGEQVGSLGGGDGHGTTIGAGMKNDVNARRESKL